jgi:hypothetical protein
MAWQSTTERETDNWQIKEKWHENVFRPRQAPTPDFLEREHTDHYRKRLPGDLKSSPPFGTMKVDTPTDRCPELDRSSYKLLMDHQ